MAHLSFTYKGYGIYLAAFQPSKKRMGGYTRSIQIRKNTLIIKSFRYDTLDAYGFSKASKKATEYIDKITHNLND